MHNSNSGLYTAYLTIQQKAADLNYASAVLGWDQETYMPPKGANFRARQLATLATQAHDLLTSEKYEQLLQQLSQENLPETEHWNVLLSLKDLSRNKKLSSDFVDELSRLTSEAFNAWIDARKNKDYSLFAPSLAKMIALKRQQAELYGYKDHPYDALLDEYEKGATVAMLDPVFKMIREEFPAILDQIKIAPQVSDTCFTGPFPAQKQWDFSMSVLKKMGYDLQAGRQDYAEHPFTTSFSSEDVRITTRVDESDFASMLWSSIHEGGHALYEQGLPAEQYGLPLGAAASLGIHESQSRLWENCIGRGQDFWKYFYPELQSVFPQQLQSTSLNDFYKAMNKVSPSLIRTEADEITYHFHVMIRYEIEKELITGSLHPNDLRDKWNSLYQHYLDVTPSSDVTGVLQDVHWSHGSFGYFPTYTLGSFYAAQFYEQAQKDIFPLPQQVSNGDFGPLLHWLREKVHRHGRRYTSEELCQQITGNKLDPSHFMKYVQKKYTGIYGIK